MKKIISSLFVVGYCIVNAQETPPPIIKNPLATSNGLKVNSRRGTMIEKQIFDLGKFKDLTIQRIVLKDTSDNSSESILGIMTEYETFDQISKKTLTLEKTELSKLIAALQSLQQKENENSTLINTKYKFQTTNSIEFGAVYNENKKAWQNYILFPPNFYSQNISNYSKEELKDLIKLLKTAEEKL